MSTKTKKSHFWEIEKCQKWGCFLVARFDPPKMAFFDPFLTFFMFFFWAFFEKIEPNNIENGLQYKDLA